MLSIESIKLLSIASNTAIVFASVTAVLWSLRHLINDSLLKSDDQRKLTNSSKGLIFGMMLWSTGEAMRIGWWVPAMLFAKDGDMYHNFFNDYRWVIYAPAALLIIFGVGKTINELDGSYSIYSLLFGAFLVGISLAVVHHFMVYM